jgi:hypothetical protein
MHHVIAYFQNGDFGGADTLLNAVQDQSVFVSGKDIRVPPGMGNVIGEFVTTIAATRSYAQVQSPSLRKLANIDVGLFNGVVTGLLDTNTNYHPYDPRKVDEQESLNFLVNSDDAGAQDHFGIIQLSDGPLQPIDGEVITVRATATIAQANGVWVSGAITFQQKLPVQKYKVVGMRCVAATGIWSRLIFPNSGWRPGCPVVNTLGTAEVGRFRNGQMGVWGEFDINAPPQLEMFAGAAAAQTIYLDLIKS